MLKDFVYRGRRFYYHSKKELLEKLTEEFLPNMKKGIPYINFYIWQRRISPSMDFEEKLKLYFDYHITRKIIKENQVNKTTYKKQREKQLQTKETEDISELKHFGEFGFEDWAYTPKFDK